MSPCNASALTPLSLARLRANEGEGTGVRVEGRTKTLPPTPRGSLRHDLVRCKIHRHTVGDAGRNDVPARTAEGYRQGLRDGRHIHGKRQIAEIDHGIDFQYDVA